jgi:thiol-disulfide isomerase/thioredoxin
LLLFLDLILLGVMIQGKLSPELAVTLALINPLQVFRTAALALFDPQLIVLGPVGLRHPRPVRRRRLQGLRPGLSLQAAAADPLFAVKLTGTDDKPVALESFRGKPLIVNFWARWCGPCRKEIPELVQVQDKYRKAGLVVLGIGLEDKAESVRDFMKAYDVNYTVLLARDQGIPLMQALGNVRAGLPFTVIIDRRGEILATRLGAMNREQLEAAGKAAIQ